MRKNKRRITLKDMKSPLSKLESWVGVLEITSERLILKFLLRRLEYLAELQKQIITIKKKLQNECMGRC